MRSKTILIYLILLIILRVNSAENSEILSLPSQSVGLIQSPQTDLVALWLNYSKQLDKNVHLITNTAKIFNSNEVSTNSVFERHSFHDEKDDVSEKIQNYRRLGNLIFKYCPPALIFGGTIGNILSGIIMLRKVIIRTFSI